MWWFQVNTEESQLGFISVDNSSELACFQDNISRKASVLYFLNMDSAEDQVLVPKLEA